MKQNKGQLTLADAPTVVLIVGLVFLLLATMAYVGSKYGDATDTDGVAGSGNETVTRASLITTAGATLSANNLENGVCSAVTKVYNGTGGVVIAVGNFTQTGCVIKNSSDMTAYTATSFRMEYPYTYSAQTVASNVTGDLETEISNNTSIAGIVLTISLVGIVLSVLIGIFMAARRGGM